MKFPFYLVMALALAGLAPKLSAQDSSSLETRDNQPVSIPSLPDLHIPACSSNITAGEECILDGEQALIDDSTQKSFSFQQAQNPAPAKPSQRDFHPRQHACLAGTWTPLPNLPAEIAVGIFAQKQPQMAVIRYSNGSPKDPRGSGATPPDGRPDARGLAIKVVGVPGQSILNLDTQEPPPAGHMNQDFVLINFPAFFLRSPTSYPEFLESVRMGKPFTMDDVEKAVFAATNSTVPDVMAERFWSQTPYKLGGGYAKYSVHLCDPKAAAPATPAELNDPQFLRQRIVSRLAQGPICLVFSVQVKAPGMAVEDAAVEWTESADAPFVDVARIEIPGAQDIKAASQNAYCENTSFNPWNSFADNRPAGAMNRVRLAVYAGISRKRRMEDSVPLSAPKTSDSFFDVLRPAAK